MSTYDGLYHSWMNASEYQSTLEDMENSQVGKSYFNQKSYEGGNDVLEEHQAADKEQKNEMLDEEILKCLEDER